jgi:hypothetical protein
MTWSSRWQGERTPEPHLFAYYTHIALRAPAEDSHSWRPWLVLGLAALACTALALALVGWLVRFDLDGLLLALRMLVALAFPQ